MTRLIGIGSNGAGAGKDVAADRLVAVYPGWEKMGMSDALLDHMLILDPFIEVKYGDPVPLAVGFYRASRLVAILGYTQAKQVEDFRRFMLKDGTEGGRDFHYRNIWVDKIASRIEDRLAAGARVVVTGVRFDNELEMIHRLGGESWWIERPDLNPSKANATAAAHASQNSLRKEDFDRVFVNDGTRDDLRRKVDLRISTREQVSPTGPIAA